MSDLAETLKRVMTDHEPPFSALGLAKKLGYEGNWMVSSVLNQERAIPVDDIERWADALELRGDAKTEFIVTAHLERSTPFVREFVRQIRHEVRRNREMLSEIKSDLERAKRKGNEALAQLEERDRTIAHLRKLLDKLG